MHAICTNFQRQFWIGCDEERQVTTPRDMRQSFALRRSVRASEVAIDQSPAAGQGFGCSDDVRNARGIGEQEHRRQPVRQMLARLPCRLKQLAIAPGLRFLRHRDD